MKKLANPFWFGSLLMVTSVLAVIIVFGPPSVAQEEPPPVDIVALEQEIAQLKTESRFEEAAEHYRGLITAQGASLDAQDTAIQAGSDMEKAKLLPQAVSFYDRALTVAEARADLGQLVSDEFIETVRLAAVRIMPKQYYSIEGQLFGAHFMLARARLNGWDTTNEQIDYARKLRLLAIWQDARQLESEERYTEAAGRYAELMTLENRVAADPLTAPSLCQAILAGEYAAECLEKAGHLAGAISYCDQILAITNVQWDVKGKIRPRLQHREQMALTRKAKLCYQAGRLDEARGAVQRLKEEYPDYPCTQFEIIEAQLGSGSEQEAQLRHAREQEAAELLRTARQVWKHKRKNAFGLIANVATNYSDTAAGMRASFLKGQIISAYRKDRQRRQAELPPGSELAQILSPVPEATLNGSTVTFSWTPGKGVTQYHLRVANNENPDDPNFVAYFSADLDGSVTSQEVTNLPTDGSAVYVKLFSYFPDLTRKWRGLPYAYTTEGVVDEDETTDPPSSLANPAVDAFANVVALIKESARKSVIAQQARHQQMMAYTQVINERIHNRQSLSDDEWEHLRSICSDIIEHNWQPFDRIAAHFKILESYAWHGSADKGLEASKAFFTACESVENPSNYKWQTCWAYHLKGIFLQRLGRFDEALEQYRRAIQLTEDYKSQWLLEHETEDGPDMTYADSILQTAHYRIWLTLLKAKAPETQIVQAAQDIVSKFPETNCARTVGLWLNQGTE